ncbi:hypothetical protein P3T18_001919 [Paraburkholderia sp. GAS199]|uniref:hypothetical protein n=1 Tax=Paraburkholderia sp. GAS199 TaxID=3035126 RepID=UPI003D23AA2B
MPEDLPETHRSSCDGFVLEAAHTPRSIREAGRPDGLWTVIYGCAQKVSSQKVLGLKRCCNTLLLRRFSATETLRGSLENAWLTGFSRAFWKPLKYDESL